MAIDYSVFAIPKGEPRIATKKAKRLDLAAQERECRQKVKARDKGKCVVPGCKERSQHLHHIVYRSKGGRWTTANIASLCPTHHQWVHLGKIQISGNADDELIITGEKRFLEFKL